VLWLAVLLVVLVVGGVVAVVLAIPAVLSSDAAARTASEVLTKSLGRPVEVGDLEFGWSSGLAVRKVSIASPAGFASRPFFSIGEFAVRPRVLSLFSGRFVIDEVVIDGPEIYVERHADGAMNLPSMGEPGAAPTAAPAAPAPASAGPPAVEIEVRKIVLRNAAFTLNDASLGKPLEVKGFGFEGRAEALADRLRCEIANVVGTVNGGTVKGQFAVQDGKAGSELAAALQAKDVALGLELTNLLKAFVPLLAAVPTADGVQGKVQFDLEAAGKGADRDAMVRAVAGKAKLGITDGSFTGAPLLKDLAAALQNPGLATYRFKDHRGTFTIRDGKIFNDSAEFTGDVPVTMKGWVDFGMQMDYQVKVDPKGVTANAQVAQAVTALNQEGGIRVAGPVNGPKVHFDVAKILKAGAKAYLEDAVKGSLGGAVPAKPGDAAAPKAPDAIQKGLDGLLKKKK
jgi:uncharacterized protein involved in outer membrane biogenesis